ncbi:hypothetical protein ACFB49_38090 [Sphingomonas sp. DBB INV C78]|uniref:PilZ domain-containing protein n=1 Tax=Sphingomonas sp. DBB INV C78 TaxID=3349434 RepID=UPI0036D36774
MSLAAKLRQTFDDEERRSTRTRLRLDAGVRHGSDSFSDIIVHDLSADGFRAESMMELSPGTTVEVELPGIGVCEADVMWAGHPYAGCAFAHPLLREQVRAALAHSPVVWGEFGDEPASAQSRGLYFDDYAITAEIEAAEAQAAALAMPPLPLGNRLRAIFGINTLLWAVVAGLAWAVFA